MFGGASSGGSGFSFGQSKPSTGFSFGGNTSNATSSNTTGGFGLAANKPSGGFGFGAANNANPASSSLSQPGFGAKPAGTGGFSFGNATNNNSNTNSGGLFGGGNASTNNNAATGTGTGGTGFSFGGNGGAATSNSGALSSGTSGNLFGAKPATGGTTGFGFGNNNNNNSNNNTTSTSGFGFGSSNTGTQGGGLFGNKPLTATSTTGSLFGNNSNNNNALTKPGTSGGLFGGNSSTSTGTSLFGNNNASSQFSFGAKPANTTGGSLFGAGSSNGLAGQQQQQTQLPQITAMTKVGDLPPPAQEELKQLDEYIQTQVAIAEYLKNQKEEHQELIISVPRDISYLEKTYASTSQALTADLKFVESFKSKTLESFNDWVEKLIKVFLQLTNPMSSSSNDQGQLQGSSKVVIGVSGNRTESLQQQQQQQKQGQNGKSTSINITAVLNSYYIEKIEDFKDKIEKYELILQEVENCVNDLDNPNVPTTVEGRGGLEMVINTLQEEFKLYVELTNEFAEIHHNVSRLAGDKDSF